MIDEELARGSRGERSAQAAAAEIMPRFRQLAAHEIVEKSGPHDLVTDADRVPRSTSPQALTALLPGSVVVGEEAVHADPATYEALQRRRTRVDRRPRRRHPAVRPRRPGLLHARRPRPPRRGPRLLDVRARRATRWPSRVRGRGACSTASRCGPVRPSPARSSKWRPPTRTTPRTRRSARCSGLRTEGVAPAPVRLGGPGVSGRRPRRAGRGRLQLGGRLGPRGGAAPGRRGGRRECTLAGEPFRIAGGNALPFTAARDAATARRMAGAAAAAG